MGKKIQKVRAMVVAVFVGCACFFGVGIGLNLPDKTTEADNSYQQFQGRVYDEERLEPVDMSLLVKLWQDKTGKDNYNFGQKSGWTRTLGTDGLGTRYYQDNKYLLGWQYLERNGAWDWYYFAEDTGFMVKSTILDGVVLSGQGYATAVSAATEDTLHAVDQAQHCEEVILQGEISVGDPIVFTKDMRITSMQGEEGVILARESQFYETVNSDMEQDGLLLVENSADLTIGSQVRIDANNIATAAVNVLEDSTLYCYGDITRGKVGIYSQGNTYLMGSSQDESARTVLGMTRVHAEKLTYLSSIYGNTDHGILQNGGTLTMVNGRIYNNGTLGGYDVTGSYGGGVHLTNGAVMDMSNGYVGGNKGVYGGGVYIDTGCTMNMTGGSVGGPNAYDMSGSNIGTNGNYVRENQLAGNGYKYSGGGGGGICSKGTLNVTAERTTMIGHNRLEGSVGGAGILLISGTAHFSGDTVVLYNNLAYGSAADSDSNVVGNEDANAEGGGLRIGLEESGSVVNCVVNCENAAEYPEVTGEFIVRDNTATGDGGGIFVSSNTGNQLIGKGTITIDSNDSGADGGGGVKSNGGGVYLYGAVISSNTADTAMGGGVLGAGTIDLENCTIYKNTAGTYGGGVAFYTSPQGRSADGYVHGCLVYNNTASLGGSGVEVSGKATGRIQGDSKIYWNKSSSAVHCSDSGNLLMGISFVYGNQSYGIWNQGNCEIAATVRIGFSEYASTSEYAVSANTNGGVYNEGTLVVSDSKNFLVYGGEYFALKNAEGTVSFENGSGSRFYGKNATQIVWNQGIMTAAGEGFLNSPLVTIIGDHVDYGLNNDGGSVIWRGNVLGEYSMTDTSMTTGATGAITYGLYNQNGGVLRIQDGRISGNQIGVQNTSDSQIYITGGSCENSVDYGVYCEAGSQMFMSEAAAIDTSNRVFLEEGCYIDINGPLTATGTIALLDTAEGTDRAPGRIMAKVTYSGGDGAAELYDDSGSERFKLVYDVVDGGSPAFLLDGSQIQGISESVAATITDQDIYLSTLIEENTEIYLHAWLYNRTEWLRNQMAGNKTDEQYKTFMTGDTGVITFSCQNIENVYITWPSTGAADELKSYDTLGTQICDQTFAVTELTESLSDSYENSSYQFQVPLGTPDGIYYVTVIGKDVSGQDWSVTLPVNVGDGRLVATFRTRIR